MSKKLTTIGLLIACLAVVALIAPAWDDSGRDLAQAEMCLTDFDQCNQALRGELLAVRLGMAANYDELTEAEREMRQSTVIAQARLGGLTVFSAGQPAEQQLKDLVEAVEQVLKMSLDFKAGHAIMRNSMAGLVKFSSSASQQGLDANAESRMLAQLELAGVRFCLSGSSVDQQQFDWQVQQARQYYATHQNQLGPAWQRLLSHAQVLLTHRARLHRRVDALLQAPIEERLAKVRTAILADYSLRSQRARLARVGLLGAVVLLVCFCAYQYRKLASQAREIRESNHQLEKRAEERTRELRKESEHAQSLATIVKESPIEVYVLNQVSLAFKEANKGACQSTGYQHEELLKMSLLDLEPELDLITAHKRIQEIAKPGVQKVEYEAKHRRADGTEYDVQVTLYAAVHTGTPVYVAFIIDQTDRNRLEQRLAQAQKLESIGQLAAGVAHEINSPMQFIGTNVEFLRKAVKRMFGVIEDLQALLSDSKLSPELQQRCEAMETLLHDARFDHLKEQTPSALEDCQEGVNRVVEIVRAMKQFSHPGTNQMQPAPLNDLVSGAKVVSKNRWKFFAQVELDLDPEVGVVPCFAAELNQVLLNLVVNAADAIADSRTSESDPLGTIWLRTRLLDDAVVIECEDTGCGIPEQLQNRIFDPFFTTKEVGKGTGQGLAISHNIVVNRHGGELLVDSEPGVGTTFRVILPLRPAAPVQQEQEETATAVLA